MKQYLKVLVCFLTKEAGGRQNPLVIGDNYCPHFRILGDDEYLGIRFMVENEQYIEPDLWFQAEVLLLYHPNVDYSKLKVGQEFEILEGNRRVGIGTVTSTISVRVEVHPSS